MCVCVCVCVCVVSLNSPNQIALFILHIQMLRSTCTYSLCPLCQKPHPYDHSHIYVQIQTRHPVCCCPPKSFSAVRFASGGLVLIMMIRIVLGVIAAIGFLALSKSTEK